MEIVVTVGSGRDAEETVHTFEEKFPHLSFNVETVHSAKFQNQLRRNYQLRPGKGAARNTAATGQARRQCARG